MRTRVCALAGEVDVEARERVLRELDATAGEAGTTAVGLRALLASQPGHPAAIRGNALEPPAIWFHWYCVE